MSGLDLGAAVNSAADWLCSAPIVRGVVSNPIFTALLITALVMIVILALYREPVRRAGLKRGARAFIYIFLLGLAVMFVHHYAVMRSAARDAEQRGVRDIFASISQSRVAGVPGAVPVVPSGYEQPYAEGAPAGYEGGARPDNVAPDNVAPDLFIEDVVIPSSAAPFGAK